MSIQTPETLITPRRLSRAMVLAIVLGLLLLLTIVTIVGSRLTGAGLNIMRPNVGTVIVLALPTFLAGMLSFLSPCCMPVLSAYFAFTLQTQRERMMLMTVAFFLGVATTMVALGATATALSRVLFQNLPTLTLVGGVIVIAFGVFNLLGKGFGGMQFAGRPGVGVTGAYVYGATFALGWSACVGPLLGALLTMLATQGVAVLEGALLAFIYALGLGAPLIVFATFVGRIDPKSRLWRVLRGRGFSLNLGFTTLHLHSTSVVSGLMLIVIGFMLATGQLSALSRWSVQTPLAQWVLDIEQAMQQFLLGY